MLDEEVMPESWMNIPQCLVDAFQNVNEYLLYLQEGQEALYNKVMLLNQITDQKEAALLDKMKTGDS